MIVLGTTLAAFAMDDADTWGAWLYTVDEMRSRGHDIQPFVAIQVDARGLAPFLPLLKKLEQYGGEHWVYSLDDGRTKITTGNRLRHLTTGQNLVTEYACAQGASHLLFCAADCAPPAELEKLLEMDHGYVGPEITTYCLSGQPMAGYDYPVMAQPLSVACVLIRRDVFTRIRWRADGDRGLADDFAYAFDVTSLLGIQPLCRKDVFARHYPQSIGPIEGRGHDMRVVR